LRYFIFTFALAAWGQTSGAPEPVKSSITVSEKIAADAPAAITVVTKEQLAANPGVNLDDRLRSVPGFSLFRRSSSLVANPTTQGLSLRGLGSSGASRTLVLWDGVPLNDPFGGWVYWTRVDAEELERVEVVRGASTSLFGDRAMGGSLSLFSKQALPWRLHGAYEGGNRNTHQLSGGFSHLFSRMAVSTNVRAFQTDGFYIVPTNRRGSVDTRAGVDFVAGDVRLDYLGGKDRMFVKLDILAEQRENGTVLQTNSTSLGNLSANYSRDNFTVLGWHTREQFHANFSTIAANRLSERLSSVQSVPSEATGAAGFYRWQRSDSHLLAGGDLARVEGYSLEAVVPTGNRNGGGVQWQRGGFVQVDTSWKGVKFFSGMRLHNTAVTNAGGNTFWNPSAGLTYGRRNWRSRATVYRSFRAATLNELYREFRAGNAVTRANAALRPEFSRGAEAGFDWYGERWTAQVTGYYTELTDLITNVTLSVTPNLIERQRRNAAAARTRGVEASTNYRWRGARLELAYLFADSRFQVPTRTRIPQVPRHQGNAILTWISGNNKTLLSGGIRSFGMQFEDDVNLFRLPGYGTLQVAGRRVLTGGLSVFASVENVLNREFLVAFNPLPQVGAPRLWRGGLRWDGRIRR
jgi:outer membrane receptor protein involved in Fe transport